MEISAKKIVVNLFYYTMALLVVLFSVLFMVRMSTLALATYQMIIYYIWAGIVILVLIADVIAAMRQEYKLITGLVIYGLMLLAVVMGFIVFASLNVGGIIPVAVQTIYSTLMLYSIGLTIGLIVVYCLGLNVMRLDNEKE